MTCFRPIYFGVCHLSAYDISMKVVNTRCVPNTLFSSSATLLYMVTQYLRSSNSNLQSTWEPSAVGYIRHDPKIYEAPVYITSFRGPTYVFLATLKTEDPVSKWTLTGTAVLLQTDE